MRFFGCAACDAKDAALASRDSEIAFLRVRVQMLEDKLFQLADPLIDARMAAALPQAASDKPVKVRRPWYAREDKPAVDAQPEKSNAEIHDSFRVEEKAG